MKAKNTGEFHRSIMIGGTELVVYIEKTSEQTKDIIEFIFEIANTTNKKFNFTITELYKIFSFVQGSLKEIIESLIIPKLKEKNFELRIEAEDDCNRLFAEKDRLYDHHLDRLCMSYTSRGYTCTHTKAGMTHALKFYMLTE